MSTKQALREDSRQVARHLLKHEKSSHEAKRSTRACFRARGRILRTETLDERLHAPHPVRVAGRNRRASPRRACAARTPPPRMACAEVIRATASNAAPSTLSACSRSASFAAATKPCHCVSPSPSAPAKVFRAWGGRGGGRPVPRRSATPPSRSNLDVDPRKPERDDGRGGYLRMRHERASISPSSTRWPWI